MTSPLGHVALFKELPEPGLQMLAERGRPKHFATGEVIMRQGDVSDALHVITRGRVRVERDQPGDTPLVLAELGAGDVIGEMGLLDGGPRSATVTATSDLTTLTLVGWDFTPLLDNPSFTRGLLMGLCKIARQEKGG